MVGAEKIVENEGGADLWRSHDGENWLPVTDGQITAKISTLA